MRAHQEVDQQQVLPDFGGFIPPMVASVEDMGEDVKLEGWAEITEAKENQNSCIKRYLLLEEGEVVSAPKIHRRSTWKLLKALDHALKIMTGFGLEKWMQKPEGLELLSEPASVIAFAHMSTIPRGLSIVADQAGNGLSAFFFLTFFFGLSTMLMADPPHRFWNSEKLGLVQGGGWEVVALMTLVFNINLGPWKPADGWQNSQKPR